MELNSQFSTHLVTIVMNHLRIMVTLAGQYIYLNWWQRVLTVQQKSRSPHHADSLILILTVPSWWYTVKLLIKNPRGLELLMTLEIHRALLSFVKKYTGFMFIHTSRQECMSWLIISCIVPHEMNINILRFCLLVNFWI